jgi:C4-dicarboxylate transporter
MKKSCFVAVILAMPMLAQTDRANLTGTVTDPSGAVVAGANVTAVATGTAINRTTETNSKGFYFLSALPIGGYTLTIKHPGSAPPSSTK